MFARWTGMAGVLAGAAIAMAQPAAAGTVLDYYAGTGVVNPFGEIAAGNAFFSVPTGQAFATYVGQTFTAPEGLAQSVMVRFSSGLGPDGVDFRVLLAEVDSAGTTPTRIIYRSDVYTFGATAGGSGVSVGEDALLSLGGTDLEDGRTYAFVLDAVSPFDGIEGWAALRTTTTAPGRLLARTYETAINQPADPYGWLAISDPQLAYRMVFEDGGIENPLHDSLGRLDGNRTAPFPVPEPSSWALMISGFGLAGLSLRRRRSTGAA